MLLLTAKNIAIFFALATTAFCVSTIFLALKKSNLENELEDALHKLDKISTWTTPPASGTSPITPYPTTATEQPPSTSEIITPSTIIPSSTDRSTSTGFPWPTMTVPNEPIFPTLPPGLPNPDEIIYRLPKDIRPVKYRLYIQPQLNDKSCEGTVSIQIEIEKETNLIVMHSKNLEINSVSILNMMARLRIRIKKIYLDAEREMLFIELEEILFTSTAYTVSISYNCQLNGLVGLYASSYSGADKKERYMQRKIATIKQIISIVKSNSFTRDGKVLWSVYFNNS